jgi:hypothetical protein
VTKLYDKGNDNFRGHEAFESGQEIGEWMFWGCKIWKFWMRSENPKEADVRNDLEGTLDIRNSRMPPFSFA